MASLYKYLPADYHTVEDTFSFALIKAIDQSHENLEALIENAIQQLFLSTATGRNLIQLGQESGFTMPPNSGLDIRALRDLISAMVASPKQVVNVINELLEIFYGATKVRPSIISTVAGSYSLADGDDLIVETESGITTIVVIASQVSNISNVTADEIAGIMNSSQSVYFADTVVDRTTGLSHVRITPNSYGARAYVRIIGGTLQNIIQMPKLVSTGIVPGTTFLLSKIATYNDLLTFRWDGIGTNPEIFNVSPQDIVTIRGFSSPDDTCNGSFVVEEAGYDYFIIKNSALQHTSGLVSVANDSIVFTSSSKNKLTDLDEFALVSETGGEVIVTVPAVPPLIRRFLSGSAHLHGYSAPVLDFDRYHIKIDAAKFSELPSPDNVLFLSSQKSMLDFRGKSIKTNSRDSDLVNPTYFIDSSNPDDYAMFPFSVPTSVGMDSIYAELGDNSLVLNCSIPHALHNFWGFNLSATSSVGNITLSDLNREQKVDKVINSNTLSFSLYDSSGNTKKFSGVLFSGCDVIQHNSIQADGSDFYMQFAAGGAILSGLQVGMTFKLDPTSGALLSPFVPELRYRKMYVTSISDDNVNFSSGYGIGTYGTVISGTQGFRSSYLGGTLQYSFDKESDWNQSQVMNGLMANFVSYTPNINPNYVGSFLYDPIGVKSKNTVSKYITNTADRVLKGSNVPIVFVNTLTLPSGEEFPKTGKLLFDNGTDKVEGPVSYFSTISSLLGDSQIMINPAYRFQHTHEIGALVQYIHDVVPFTPSIDGTDFPAYLTGTVQARNTLFLLLDTLIAAGAHLEKNWTLPDLRYSDESVQPFE